MYPVTFSGILIKLNIFTLNKNDDSIVPIGSLFIWMLIQTQQQSMYFAIIGIEPHIILAHNKI